jgi:hypothetical protein
MGYERDGRDSIPDRDNIFVSTSQHLDLFSGSPCLSNGYRGLFPRGLSGRGVKLTVVLVVCICCGYFYLLYFIAEAMVVGT